MPQPKSGSSKSRSSAKTTPGRAQPKRSPAGSSVGAARATRSSASPAKGSRSTSSARSTKANASPSSPERLRKLNERIIEAGKQTGESTLSSYEKALKAIAGAVERGPGSSDIDWISHLATTQAKFIRDVTELGHPRLATC